MKILLAPEAPAAAGAPPAAAPAPSPSPAPAAAPSPTPAAAPENPFAEMDAAFDKAGIPPAPKKEDKPDPNAAGGQPAKPAAASPGSPKPQEKPSPAATPQAPKQLREQLEKVTGELTESKTTLETLQKKLTDAESKGKDTTALLAQIDNERKEKEQLQAELRALKQETTPEFKAKYDTPFNDAAEFAKSTVVGLEKADGQPATWDDFVGIFQTGKNSLNKAISEAKTLFGDNASIVIGQLTELNRLDFQRARALDVEKKEWAKRSEADAAKSVEQKARDVAAQQEQRKQFETTWKKVNEDLENSVELYRVPPDDKELSDSRTKALAIFDTPAKDQREMIVKNAHIRHRVGMYGANQITINRLKKQVEDLEKQVAELNPEPPGGGKAKGGTPDAATEPSWEEGARKAVNSAR